ncbi:MAG: hypothetical protein KDG55_10465 [Rhodocyclaceae bacterium]|nr:hypothetical protein [Rhodocyclaceae bacterium]
MRHLWLVLACLVLAACGGARYTRDDGRPLDPALLARIKAYGEGERALHSALARAASLNDPECSRSFALPFTVATSRDYDEDMRVAWVRVLDVDERLSVVAAVPGSPLVPGDRIEALDGEPIGDRPFEQLARLRDFGQSIVVRVGDGKNRIVKPFEVCRGLPRLALPVDPDEQDYHWETVVHPLELVEGGLTADEALWIVLWGQGLSESGGLRMKTFQYTRNIVGAAIEVASLASGLSGAAEAARIASDKALESAAQSASEAVASKALEQAAIAAAEEASREYAAQVGRELGKAVGRRALSMAQSSFMTRVGMSLTALSWVASTAFDEADAWAFQRMIQLGANPLASASLHRKLATAGRVRNAFALDEERLDGLTLLAEQSGRSAFLSATLFGPANRPNTQLIIDMPSASHAPAALPSTSGRAAQALLPVSAGSVPAGEGALPLQSDRGNYK